jgi:GntR family transcriptional regulator / MocR family aminotransferase
LKSPESKRAGKGTTRRGPAHAAIALFSIQKKPGSPLYVQLFQQIRKAIVDGRLKAGTKLPSTRKLQEEFGISRNTTTAAIELLFAEGLVEGKTGSGTFVTSPAPALSDEQVPEPTPGRHDHLSQTARDLLDRCVDVTRDGHRPFEVYPAFDQFPFATWERLTIGRLRSSSRKLYLHGEAAGLFELRAAIADYLRQLRGVTCRPEQIVVTSGATQALDLVARVLINPGDTVIVEDPTEPRVRSTMRLAGANVEAVAVDRDGLDLSRTRSKTAKLVHVTASCQYPLGASLSEERRKYLRKWVGERDAYIVEFDIGGEFWATDFPIRSAAAFDIHDRTIYIGTFSQVLLPALRIGYLVLPISLVDPALRIRAVTDRHLPILLQATLADFMTEGYLGRHIVRMKRVYGRRLRALCEALQRSFGTLAEVTAVRRGLHVVLTFTMAIDDRQVAAIAAGRGIVVHPLSLWYAGPSARSGLILGIGAAHPDRIQAVVQELRYVVDDVLYETRMAGADERSASPW